MGEDEKILKIFKYLQKFSNKCLKVDKISKFDGKKDQNFGDFQDF